MQADIAPLLVIHMNPGFTFKSHLFGYLRLAVISHWGIFSLPANKVIAWPWRYARREFSPMVRDQVPVRMLFGLWSNGDVHSVQRPVIWAISGAKNQRIRLFFFGLILAHRYTGREQRHEHTDCRTRGRVPAAAQFSNHRPRHPRRLRRLPHPRPDRPPDSIQADAS